MRRLLIENLAEVATPTGAAALAGADQGRVRRLRQGEVLCEEGRIALRRHPRGAPRGLRRARRRRTARRRRRHRGARLRRRPHPPALGRLARDGVRAAAGRQSPTRRSPRPAAASCRPCARRAPPSPPSCSPRCSARLEWMLACGTTTAEAKSGYGLSLADETKQLETIARAGAPAAGRAGADPARRPRGAARAPLRARALRRDRLPRRSCPRSPRAVSPASATSSASAASSRPRNPGACSRRGARTASSPACTPTSSPTRAAPSSPPSWAPPRPTT